MIAGRNAALLFAFTDSTGAFSVGLITVGALYLPLFFPFWALKLCVLLQPTRMRAKQVIPYFDKVRVRIIFIVVTIEFEIDKFCSNFVVWS